MKNKDNTAYQHTEGQNSYQSPSFKQKQSKCQCSFTEPELIPEYGDNELEQNIRCEQNDWTEQEHSQAASEQCAHIPTAQFLDNEIDLINDVKNEYDDEPQYLRTIEDGSSTNGSNKVIQLNASCSEEE